MHGMKNVQMTGTAKVKSSLRMSNDQRNNSSNPYSVDDSASKTESQYEDEFDSISKS